MPKPFLAEFRRDDIAPARGGAGRAEIARDFGISQSDLARFAEKADRQDGLPASPSCDRGGRCTVWLG